MDISKTSNYKDLLRLAQDYLGDNKDISGAAEASLLEKTLSGEEFIGLLGELGVFNKIELQKKEIRLEELQKEYDELNTNYHELASTHSRYERYVEKYKPLIDALNSIIRRTSRQELKDMMEP